MRQWRTFHCFLYEMYVVYWLGVAQAGPMLSVFAESHVDVGITMHILSISSLSEVQMVHTCALRYALLSTTSKAVELRPRRWPADGWDTTQAAKFHHIRPDAIPSSRADSGPHFCLTLHYIPGRPRVGSPRLGFTALNFYFLHIYINISILYIYKCIFIYIYLYLYTCLSVSSVLFAGKPNRGHG